MSSENTTPIAPITRIHPLLTPPPVRPVLTRLLKRGRPAIVIRKGDGRRVALAWFGACQCCGRACRAPEYRQVLTVMLDHLANQGVRT